jgi:hypothetical protein
VLVLSDPLPLAAKAGLASALAVVAARSMGHGDPLSAGFVALACISPTAYAGLRGGVAQLSGSILGVVGAGVPILLWPRAHGSVVAMGLSMALVVLACVRLRLTSALLVAGFSALYVHLMPFASATVGGFERLAAVLDGIAAATLVNATVSALDADRIAARRIARVRLEVGRVLDRCASSLRANEPIPMHALSEGFAAIAALRGDLADAARERLVPGAARARRSAEHGLAIAAALEEVLHLAKECRTVADAIDRDPAADTALALRHEALARRLREESPAPDPDEPEVPLPSTIVGLSERMSRAVDAALAPA